MNRKAERKMRKRQMKQLIPPYLSEFKLMGSFAELRVSYDAPTDQSIYTYTLKWDDEGSERKNYATTSETDTSSKIPKKSAAENTDYPVMTNCDGPCSNVYPSNKLNILGRCGHYLCDNCYGIVKNDDGTKGCSSFSCNWKEESTKNDIADYEKEICQNQRKRAEKMQSEGHSVKVASSYTHTSLLSTRTSSTTLIDPFDVTSVTSLTKSGSTSKSGSSARTLRAREKAEHKNKYPSAHELITTKVMIIEEPPKNNVLHSSSFHSQLETSTSNNLRSVIERIMRENEKHLEEYMKTGKLYYIHGLSDGTKQFKHINQDQLKTKKLYEFPLFGNYLFFILDMTETLRKNSVKIVHGYDE
ncbi:unnamed protein product [Caenorhabditis angaria]|uniref:RING-type domain-containing protein n=1 Tax=Caenorhabditis angaria TaxID=860376 RepID=A0A9P1IQ41_9PELO|nr:unnamed protein product [Caenorhabditis angaria]